jgi:putative membrane protein
MSIIRLPCLLIGVAVSGIAPPAAAHAPDMNAAVAAPAWNADPWVIACLIAAALLYACGLRRLWHNAGHGAGVPVRRTMYFAFGLTMLVVALLSPVDTLGADLFSMHMVQHELLMLVAAPLIIAGRPLAVFIWAFPAGGRQRIKRMVKARAIHQPWHVLSQPFSAWSLHAVVLWAWHFPTLFQASLADDAVHAVQHFSFLASALLFWLSLIGPQSRLHYGSAVVYLLTTAIHTGVLGALLTFSSNPWYPAYAQTAGHWGFTALEDQQLGGLIMWVPAGFAFVLAGLLAAARAISPDWQDNQQPGR